VRSFFASAEASIPMRSGRSPMEGFHLPKEGPRPRRYTPRVPLRRDERSPPLPASKTPTWRRAVAYLFALALLALADPANGKGLGAWGLGAGTALCLAGAFWRIWGCGHLRKNQAVITSGPYARVRNPLYLGTLLNLLGFCAAAGHPYVVYGLLPAGILVFALYYVPKKERVESERMRKRFGEAFEVYHRAVPGYLPRLTAWEGSRPAPLSWGLVVENSEVPTALLILGGLGVLHGRFFGLIPAVLRV